MNLTKKVVAKLCRDSYCSLYCYCYYIIKEFALENNITPMDFDTFCSRLSKILNDAKCIDNEIFEKIKAIYDEGFNL